MANGGSPKDLDKTHTGGHPDSTWSAGASRDAETIPIGPYRLLRLLGEGGMGQVWLAEQKEPIQRTVALKLIKAGMDTKAVVARFESERQALALMDHPNIAQVHDAGSSAEGRPYFVMEFVPGLPITEYCDTHRLSVRQRLELFVQVCDAVQHAHQKAIIHRDLKPSNVLVMQHDDRAVPKVIDFGLAKAMGQRLTKNTLVTELGVLLGTFEYMSPEQADLRSQNVDTRTDVYSLGVILYELLVGSLPLDARELGEAGLEAILRKIREEPPQKPSTKARLLGSSSSGSAERRGEEPSSHARRLRGELDWITLKALEKDRARRYATASEFGADVHRYLRNEPVVAGPATASYRIRKYVARHRFALGAAALVAALLAVFAVVQAFQLRRIQRERDRANRVTELMTRMFEVADPNEARGNSVTAREVLDKASKDIERGLERDPELRAQLLYTLANVHVNLGLYATAETQLDRTIEIRRRILGDDNLETLRAMDTLAVVLYRRGQYDRAERLERQAFESLQKLYGPDDPATLSAMSGLSLIVLANGHRDEAERLARDAIVLERRALGPDASLTLKTTSCLAIILRSGGRYAEAERAFREVYESNDRTLGRDDPATIRARVNLATVLVDQGNFPEAEATLRPTLGQFVRVFGPEHPITLTTANNLADLLINMGRYSEAEALNRETLRIRERVLGTDHPDTIISMANLGRVLASLGRAREAEDMCKGVVEKRRNIFGPEHPDTVKAMADLGDALLRLKKYAQAERVDREALGIGRRVLGEKHPEVAIILYNLGALAGIGGRPEEAIGLLFQAVDAGLPPGAAAGLDQDPDLSPLRGNPRFPALVAHAKEVVAHPPAREARQ